MPKEMRDRQRPTDCRIQYCLFYNDRPKTFADDPADRPDNFGGNYVGGPMQIAENLTQERSQSLIDPAAGDLHLKAGATIGTVQRLPEVPEDIDRQQRPPLTTPGADAPADRE